MIINNLLNLQISYQNTRKVAGSIMTTVHLQRSTIFKDLIFHGEEMGSPVLGMSVKKKLISYLINLEYTMLLGVIRKLWRN